jgi:hypothetical protein
MVYKGALPSAGCEVKGDPRIGGFDPGTVPVT